MTTADDTIGPRPAENGTASPAPRPSLGPGYDWLMELMRQVPRPLLFIITVAAIAKNVFGRAIDRMDPTSFGLLLGFAALLCGIRGAELMLRRQ